MVNGIGPIMKGLTLTLFACKPIYIRIHYRYIYVHVHIYAIAIDQHLYYYEQNGFYYVCTKLA